MTAPLPSSPAARARWGRRSAAIALAVAATVPALALRLSGAGPRPWIAAIVFGVAVVGAAFVLAWAAEALQLDVSQGLALAVLALIAVLPEYAVDLVFTWKAGENPRQFAPLALANMTGANRLLIGVGWSLVVLLAAWRIRRAARRELYEGPLDTEVRLDRPHSIEIAFLGIATLYSLTLPLKRRLTLVDSFVLVTLFVLYLVRISRAPAEEPELVGPAELIGRLPTGRRRAVIALMLGFSAGVILVSAEPFAGALVDTGEELGVSTFLLVQWLAPLASEAPELIIAGLFAWRLNTNAGLGTLVSSKVNQWTLLVGSLPIVFTLAAAHGHGLPLDHVQREELFLTAAQSVFAVAVLADRSITVRNALTLLGLFSVQFVLSGVLPNEVRVVERVGIGFLYLVLSSWILFAQRGALTRLFRDGVRTPIHELIRDPVPPPTRDL